jgi:hypothetical protein
MLMSQINVHNKKVLEDYYITELYLILFVKIRNNFPDKVVNYVNNKIRIIELVLSGELDWVI